LEKFDSLFNVEASITADTAYYYDKTKLWKLMGDVHIENLQNEKFDTELLYWDQNKHTIYSDRFVRIEQPERDRIITGQGFDSNEQMTVYAFRNAGAIMYFTDTAPVPADSIPLKE
jgi:LPS export ABC transporter protein LptC